LCKRGLYISWVVHEIQYESVLLERVRPVETREGLHGLDAIEAAVDVERVEQGLVESCLVFLSHQQHLKLGRGKGFRQGFSGKPPFILGSV